jgi:hypothetical protein
MAVDIRYVGTRGIDQWSELNYNDIDIITNGFVDEFKLAVNNLKANNAAGGSRTGSFAYFGSGTGTSPLPIYMAYLRGAAGNPNSPSSYTGSNWTSTSFTNDMVFVNPNPGNSAADLDGSSTFRANAIAAGLPANFLVLNPAVDDVNVYDSGAYSDYHALQVELRRRLSHGLFANLSYQYAHEGGSAFDGFYYGREMVPSANVRSRHQDPVGLDPAGWPWDALRDRHESMDGRAPRGLVVQGHRSRAGPDDELRQRAPRRHVREGPAEHVQVLHDPERHGAVQVDLHAAGGRA